MKKNKLSVTPDFAFELLGIISPYKDYKIAWAINQSLGIRLAKKEDLSLEFNNGEHLVISCFFQKNNYGFLQLLKNRSIHQEGTSLYLLPELKIMDYFLMIQDDTCEIDINEYIGTLSKSSLVQNVVKLDIAKIKSKENLLTY